MNAPTLETPTAEPDMMSSLDTHFDENSALHDGDGNKVAPAVPEPKPAAVVVAPPEPAPAPVKAPEPVAPAAPIEGLDDLPVVPKKAPKVEAAKPAAEFDPEKAPINEFRKVYKTTKEERDTYKKQAEELDARLKAAPQVDEQKIRAEYSKKENEYQQKIRDYEEKLGFYDYSQTQEYKDRFVKPWNDANDRALEDLRGVIVLDGEVEREATIKDVGALLGMTTVEASRKAKELFGDAAPIFMQHRSELLKIHKASEAAKAEWKEKGSQYQTQQQETERQHRERVLGLYSEETERYRKTAPEIFGEEPGDDEGNQLLRKFEPLVNLALKGEGLPDGLSKEQRSERIVKAQANVAMRAMAFGRERLRNVRLTQQLEDLKEKLKSYEKSEPNPTDNPTSTEPQEKSIIDKLDDIR